MGKSWSQTIMKDQRTVIEEAQIFAAPESDLTVTQALPGSVAIGERAVVGDIVVQEYSPGVQKTVGQLIDSFSMAIGQSAETSQKVTEVLGEKLQQTQVGSASILPLILIAAVVVVVAGKVWK